MKTTLQLSKIRAERVLQWYPFQTRSIDLDQLLAVRIEHALRRRLSRVPLTRGECLIISRWFRSLIPGLVRDEDVVLNGLVEQFLNRQSA